jgi:hypothetical protein
MPMSAILLLAAFAICLVIDIAGVAVGIRLWRARPAGAPITTGMAVYLVVTIVSLALVAWAVLRGILTATGVGGGDPSQRARLLAEGISEAINNLAFVTLVATPCALAVLIYAWRRRSRSDAQRR